MGVVVITLTKGRERERAREREGCYGWSGERKECEGNMKVLARVEFVFG